MSNPRFQLNALVARKDVPDRQGNVWDTRALAESLRTYADKNGVVTVDFDQSRPIGRVTGVDETDDGIYVTVEGDASLLPGWAIPELGPFSVGPATIHDDVVGLSLLDDSRSLWDRGQEGTDDDRD